MKTLGNFNKAQILGYIRSELSTNINWAKKACLLIFEKQTSHEKATYKSTENNKVGFDKFNAPRLTLIANKLKRNSKLTEEQDHLLLEIMPNYAQQMYDLMDKVKLLNRLKVYYGDPA